MTPSSAALVTRTLDGGGGADHLVGGPGTDTASYQSSTSGVKVYLGNTGFNGGGAAGDVLDSIENLIGSNQADVLAARQWVSGVVSAPQAQAFTLSSTTSTVRLRRSTVSTGNAPNAIGTADGLSWDVGSGAIYSGGPSDLVAVRYIADLAVATAGSLYVSIQRLMMPAESISTV